MRAQPGDHLVMDGDPARTGLVVGVRNEDGSPPYVVRWLANGHLLRTHTSPVQIRTMQAGQKNKSGPPFRFIASEFQPGTNLFVRVRQGDFSR